MNGKHWSLVATVTFAALLLGPSAAPAATAPPLGTVQSFAVLGGSGVTASGGAGTVVTGDVGSSPTATIIGFPPAVVAPGFFLHLTNDAVVQQARIDAFGAAGAYNALASQGCDFGPFGVDTDLATLTQPLVPGVYCFSSTALNTGTVTLSGNGIYIFRIGSSITTASGSKIVLTNGADSCDVYWQVVASATLGSSSTFRGSIFALASVSVGTTANLVGRAVAQAAVTMDGSNTVGGCSGAGGTPPPAPPTLSKAFSPSTIDPNVPSTLTITLSNPNTSVATLTAALTDSLPTNVVVAPAPNFATTCPGGVFSPVPSSGDTAVTLSAGAIPAGTSSVPGTCTVTVDVTSATPGTYLDTLPAGALMTSNGNNVAPAQATLTVNPAPAAGSIPPTVGKSLNLATIPTGGTSTLTIILSNSSTDTPDTITTLTDNLPAGLVIANPNGASTSCVGGTLTATPGSGTITLSGGTIPISGGVTAGTCTVTVNVTATLGGSYLNTIAAGDLVTDNGNNADAASATLTVTPVVPTLSKAFAPATIIAGGISSLTITLSNPNTLTATNAALLDTLPTGVVIAAAPNIMNTCLGTVTAAPGTGIIQLIGGTIPAGSGTTAGTCTVTVNVTSAAGGSFLNTLPANALQTSNGSNTVPAEATLTVNSIPVPMLSGWALLLLTALLALVAFAAMRRQTTM